MELVVAKFGGTSVADAGQIEKVASIITSDPRRRVIIVSAPGKRNSEDEKITELLISCYSLANRGEDFREPFALIRSRYHDLSDALGIGRDMDPWIDEVENDIARGADMNAVVSRGEYLAAHMIARYLGFEFVDAAELIEFKTPLELNNSVSDRKIAKRIETDGKYIIPGFYGAFGDGKIQLFTRGGSDITASIVARSLDANLYENWTDVSGLLSADPRYVKNPMPIASVTYRELRELAFLGAEVFHNQAVDPVAGKDIPIRILNTNDPQQPGTLISRTIEESRAFIAVAGRTGMRGIILEKTMTNKDGKFTEAFDDLLKGRGLTLFHRSNGCDSLFALVSGDTDWITLAAEFMNSLDCTQADCGIEMAVVGAVGTMISRNTALLSRIFKAFRRDDIKVIATRADYSNCSLMFFVPEVCYRVALEALHSAAMEH